MNKSLLLLLLLAALGLGAAGGYWWASSRAAPPVPSVRQPLYYRNPMNPQVTSPVPAKDEMGMDYVPVYAEEAPKPRRILYYRNPMGLADTSPLPKKDPMGMDYVPVYADEAEGGDEARIVSVSADKIQKLGVRLAAVERREISRTVHAVGVVEADERKLYTVALRFDGFIEKLYVNATGQAVAQGQALLELYSPDLLSTQREYLTARQGLARLAQAEPWVRESMESLADSALEKLRNWGISETEIHRLESQGTAQHGVVVRSPAAGIVMEKSAVAGMRAAAGDALFKIADLSTVWVIAEVYEQDIGQIAPGQAARVRLDAYPGRPWDGKITFIYPTLNPQTRTAKVRVELPNPHGDLKPMMYAHVDLAAGSHLALAVPRSSVLESDREAMVLVGRGAGRFEPRPVRLGLRGDEVVEVLAGVEAGEQVVVSANFLIDSESNLRAALRGFGGHAAKPEPAAADHHGSQ